MNPHICDAGKFVDLVGKFSKAETLSQELLNTLIDRIEVGEKEQTESGRVIQNISIHYKFVGELKTI